MTELTGPQEPAAQPSPDWPRLDTAAVTDPVVAQALARLEPLPDTAVEQHEATYARLHDELLDALNAEVPGAGPADSGPAVSGQADGGA